MGCTAESKKKGSSVHSRFRYVRKGHRINELRMSRKSRIPSRKSTSGRSGSTQHSDSLAQHMETSTRAASSTSIGEVATRTHQQSESEDQYESASRVFSNPNQCRAVTFLFYRINKCQTLKFELASIERRVNDPATPTGVTLNSPKPLTGVRVLSSSVLATGS